MKALVHNNKIVQVSEDIFPVHSDFSWIDCPEDCTTKWGYVNGEFTTPVGVSQEVLKKQCEDAIYNHIQAEIDDYNVANGLSLTDVYRCEQYARTSGYTHQAFCTAVWAWNVDVWETARNDIFPQAVAGEITITSPEDVLALLPEFMYNE